MERLQRSLFIFRRDLRLEDNIGLNAALEASAEVVPAFFFDPRQIEPHPYQSTAGLQFMVESLRELDSALRGMGSRLFAFWGSAHELLPDLVRELGVDGVFVNRDYTPFSVKRDTELAQRSAELGLPFHSFEDALLCPPGTILTGQGTPYTVFTPFRRRASLEKVAEPVPLASPNFAPATLPVPSVDPWERIAALPQRTLFARGGRTAALQLFDRFSALERYADERDLPALPGTSGLSTHHKFGTVSIRESYHTVVRTLGVDHGLITELYWRDFFSHVGHHFPRVFGTPFRQEFQRIQWENNREQFDCWREGRTGFPIVDAGMRELRETGFMHNRVRMIVASFLVKDLLIDWRWGERWFAQQLSDYDPAVNNGNWQWAASTGCDAQPYFRIFNPWLQQKKFDTDGRYIRRWVGELSGVPAAFLHDPTALRKVRPKEYPEPIVDHGVMRKEAENRFRRATEAK